VALLVGLALSLGLANGAPAATTWTVCASGCDYTRIKSAIAASTTLDGDTLAIAAGTYTEAGIAVNKSLTLQGEDMATTIVQAATSPSTASDRVFTIPSGVSMTLQALTIRHGRAISFDFESGGGLFNGGTLTLRNSTVRDNYAGRSGGGLFNGGTLTLRNSTLSGNSSIGNGGGLANEGTLTLLNSTVSGNTASQYGGGLVNEGTLTLLNSTVSGNSAPNGGGLDNHAMLTLTSSLVATNPEGGDCRTASGSIISDGYNVDSDGSCQLTTSTDRPGVDPLLGPLQDNGGPTFTQALLPGSPALDVIPWGSNGCGTTLVSDQRWQARPQAVGGSCDSGAYEVEVAGEALGGWVTGFTPSTVVCQNVTTGHSVTLNNPATFWDCDAAGVAVSPGDHVSILARGPVDKAATDVSGAVVGMQPSSAGCTNLTTEQQVTFQHMVGATAGSCVAAGLVVHPGETVQMSVAGAAE
jgi:hypothetical protein